MTKEELRAVVQMIDRSLERSKRMDAKMAVSLEKVARRIRMFREKYLDW